MSAQVAAVKSVHLALPLANCERNVMPGAQTNSKQRSDKLGWRCKL